MWSSLDNKSRAGLVAAIAILAVVTVVMLVWVFSDNKATLFADLDEKEASNVVLALEDMKIPYQLSKGGKDIFVNENVVEEVRVKLIGKGVKIQSGQGFELFDDADIGMTEYSQKINYLRAMQGELARSIMSIDGIKYARVHLVLPETSVFKRNKQVPTASVTIIPEPGNTLSAEQIVGIQRMLAAATPGITKENVTVQDNKGITLSNTAYESDNEQITSMLLQKKREAEAYLEAKANIILNRTFGEGNSVATISVDLVLDKVHRKEEVVLPQTSKSDGLVRKRETSTGEKKQSSKNENNSVELEYQLSKRVEEIFSMPGAIGRISVGVLVPENVGSEQIDHLKSIISMAVGIDTARGDDVAIYPMKIDLFDKAKSTDSMAVNPVADSTGKNVTGKNMNDTEAVKTLDKVAVVKHKVASYISYEQLIYIAAALILFVVILVLIIMRASAKMAATKQQGMTVQEKEKLLTELKSWMNESAV